MPPPRPPNTQVSGAGPPPYIFIVPRQPVHPHKYSSSRTFRLWHTKNEYLGGGGGGGGCKGGGGHSSTHTHPTASSHRTTRMERVEFSRSKSPFSRFVGAESKEPICCHHRIDHTLPSCFRLSTTPGGISINHVHFPSTTPPH